MPDRFDPYAVLQVSQDASQDALQAAYRALARRLHPDLSDDPSASAQMARLNAAWETVGDPERRAAYDRSHLAGVILDTPRPLRPGRPDRRRRRPGRRTDRPSARRPARPARHPGRPGGSAPTGRVAPGRRRDARPGPCSISAATSAGRWARSSRSIRVISSGSTSSPRAYGCATRSIGRCAPRACGSTVQASRPAAAIVASGCPAASRQAVRGAATSSANPGRQGGLRYTSRP